MRICLLNINEINDAEAVRKRLPQRWRRAMKYRLEEDRLRCIGAGLLLIRELGIEDESRILIGPEGKPYLADGPAFSLSHSGQYCALAVGEDRIGIDIERMDEAGLPALEAFASADEKARIGEDGPLRGFYALWTRKEALAKAVGTEHFRDPGEIDLRRFDSRCFTTQFMDDYCISVYEEKER